jgi:hypothetical protein
MHCGIVHRQVTFSTGRPPQGSGESQQESTTAAQLTICSCQSPDTYRNVIQLRQCTAWPCFPLLSQSSAACCGLLRPCCCLQRRQKPAYIEICCNLAGLTDHSFIDPPIPFALDATHVNQQSMKAAVAATVKVREACKSTPAQSRLTAGCKALAAPVACLQDINMLAKLT